MDAKMSVTGGTATRSAKKALRATLRAKLQCVSAAELARQSMILTERVLASDAYQGATRISVYLSTSSGEVQTDDLVRRMLGKDVFVPFCPADSKTVMHMLRLRPSELDSLQPNRWGIREPEPDAENALDTGGLDLVLAPGLAFDRQLNRIGHGRGYYDSYIAKLLALRSEQGLRPPVIMALALDEQILTEGNLLPIEPWDRKPDIVVSPHVELRA